MTKSIHKITNRIAPYQIKIELVLLSTLLAGLFLKDPELNYFLIVLPALSLASLYYLMVFRLENNENPMQIFLHKLTYMSLAIGSLGILFTVQNYPGNDIMLLVALLLSISILIGRLIMNFRDNKKEQIIDADLIRITLLASAIAFVMTVGF